MSTISSVSAGSQMQRPDFAQMQQNLFNKADTDGDGAISQDELQSLMDKNPRLAKALTSYAAPSDGSTATAADVLKKLDTDGDGKVSATELKTAMSAIHETRKGGHAHGHRPPAPPADGTDSDSTTGVTSTTSPSSTTDIQTLVKSLLEELRKQAGYTQDGTTSTPPSETSAVTLKTSA